MASLPSDKKIKVVENSYADDPVAEFSQQASSTIARLHSAIRARNLKFGACLNTMNSSNEKYPYPIRSSKLNFHGNLIPLIVKEFVGGLKRMLEFHRSKTQFLSPNQVEVFARINFLGK